MAGNWNSGRRPQPTTLKILRGNPGRRRLPPPEPQPAAAPASFDVPPPALAGNKRARAEWRRVAPFLRVHGIVSEGDRSTLTAYCLEWSTYLDAQAQLRDEGRVVKTEHGVGISAHVAIANTALTHCLRLAAELGLTPSGRARLARLPGGGSDALPLPKSKWAGTNV